MSMNLNQVTDLITPTTGGLSVTGIVVSSTTITTSFSIPSGYSGSSVGPISVSSGITVTIPSGSRWVIL